MKVSAKRVDEAREAYHRGDPAEAVAVALKVPVEDALRLFERFRDEANAV